MQKREIEMIKRTAADMYREEGELKALKKMLRRQLNLKFGNVPNSVLSRIRSEKDADALEYWLSNFAKAERLEDVGIPTS